jgi:hypothetical protein
MTRTIEITAFSVLLLVAALAVHAWLSSHDDQLRLQATLATQKQLLDAADARERDRNTSLNTTLAQITALKRDTQTPEEILRELPKYLSLPQPVTMSPTNDSAPAKQGTAAPSIPAPPNAPTASQAQQQGTAACPEGGTVAACKGLNQESSKKPVPSTSVPSTTVPSTPSPFADLPASPTAQIPAADLKPLYDFVQDCRACQAQLASAKLDAADNAAKISALTRERDAAITAAKGGTFWQRLRRNVLWFAVGAASGAAALCSTGHCRP